MSFKQLDLSAEILRAVADQGYSDPSPIQLQAIPPILEGKDIMGCAQTGTGKTAGFALPMLQRLQCYANSSPSPARHPVRALILVPTRELAAQVYKSVKTYGKYLALKSAVIYGGVNMNPQIEEMHAGVEILIATPGRLLDHSQQKTVNLSKVEILVLDEADRMLDMGFLPDIKQILTLIPLKRQSLMFSATFSVEIKKLADKLLKEPVLVEVARRNTVSELVTHIVYSVSKERKSELLIKLFKLHNFKQVLVFVSTKLGASRLVRQLQHEGLAATAIHGDKSQLHRTQALEEFKQGVAQVLVATDVAARGLDIEDLPHVINFELPNTPEDYIHRIGRTGRAGTKGNAISLVCEEENESLAGIEKLLKTKLSVETIAGFEHTNKRQPVVLSEKKNGKKSKLGSSLEKKNVIASKTGRSRSQGDTVRSNRTMSNEPRRHKKPEDPIFTQPYIPSTVSSVTTVLADEIDSGEKASHLRYGRHEKQLPALFIAPVPEKRK
jgi:ATP-dependent RNA helicase RhlE